MKEIMDRLKEFQAVTGFVCPAEFWPALGYDGSARYVAIWWEQCGDEASWADGRQSFVGADWESYLTLMRHNFPLGHAAHWLLGGSDVEASFKLVVDRWTEWAWLAPVDDVEGVLGLQWAAVAAEPLVTLSMDDLMLALAGDLAEGRPFVSWEPIDVLDYANGLLPALEAELARRGTVAVERAGE